MDVRERSGPTQTDTLAVDDPAIAAVIGSIRERAVKGLEIAELVTASKLSRWQLEDRFRRMVGRSIHDDILHVRLNEARRPADIQLRCVRADAVALSSE